MGVVISCFSRVGGIGLANVLFHTARAAYRSEILDAVICYGNRQAEIPSRYIRPIRFQPTKAVSFLKSRYYYTLKRMTLDKRCASYLRRRGCDIFHGKSVRIEVGCWQGEPEPWPTGRGSRRAAK